MSKIDKQNTNVIIDLFRNAKLSELLTTATLVTTIISLIYLTTYWSQFKIEIFEYIQIGSLILWAIYPFLLSLAVVPVLTFLILFFEPKSIFWISIIFTAIFILISIVVMKVFYLYIGAAIFVFGSLIIFAGKEINELIDKKKSVKIFITIIISVLVLACSWLSGLYKANKIKDGLNYKYISSTQLNNNLAGQNEIEYRYVGKVDDSMFFWDSSDKTTIILKHNQIKLLKFRYFNIEDNFKLDKEDFILKRWEFIKSITRKFI